MPWSKKINGKDSTTYCLACNLPTWKKPKDCIELKHHQFFESKRKYNNKWRKEKRKGNPYYGHKDVEAWKQRQRVYGRKRYRKFKENIYKKLGKKCWCGFDDIRALHIDHIYGGGTKEKQKLGWQYLRKLSKISTDELKKNYQILCANHHAIKSWKERRLNDKETKKEREKQINNVKQKI